MRATVLWPRSRSERRSGVRERDGTARAPRAVWAATAGSPCGCSPWPSGRTSRPRCCCSTATRLDMSQSAVTALFGVYAAGLVPALVLRRSGGRPVRPPPGRAARDGRGRGRVAAVRRGRRLGAAAVRCPLAAGRGQRDLLLGRQRLAERDLAGARRPDGGRRHDRRLLARPADVGRPRRVRPGADHAVLPAARRRRRRRAGRRRPGGRDARRPGGRGEGARRQPAAAGRGVGGAHRRRAARGLRLRLPGVGHQRGAAARRAAVPAGPADRGAGRPHPRRGHAGRAAAGPARPAHRRLGRRARRRRLRARHPRRRRPAPAAAAGRPAHGQRRRPGPGRRAVAAARARPGGAPGHRQLGLLRQRLPGLRDAVPARRGQRPARDRLPLGVLAALFGLLSLRQAYAAA